jgi:hypothetical protein
MMLRVGVSGAASAPMIEGCHKLELPAAHEVSRGRERRRLRALSQWRRWAAECHTGSVVHIATSNSSGAVRPTDEPDGDSVALR